MPGHKGKLLPASELSGQRSSFFSTISGEMGPIKFSALSHGRSSQTGSRSSNARALNTAR